ncbi:Mhf1 protein [Saccharomycopsis crataegensis]|uniref:Mhf1 protein n=1 Tax=Saccharomycopsis crataegensis TaxID=43959 RepID=A0AAV5QKH9_9ASCO|nr:Mhf1 protein [Saccharomycopsis crataegensis]
MSMEEDDVQAHLKASIWDTVSELVDQETKGLGISATPTFIAALVQLVFDQLLSVGEDLKAFADHAGRRTIVPDDMFMVTRKNGQLTELLKNHYSLLLSEKKGRQEEEYHEAHGHSSYKDNQDRKLEDSTVVDSRKKSTENNRGDFDDDSDEFDDDLDLEPIQRPSKR